MEIFAHRGAHNFEVKENSSAALSRLNDFDVDGVEIDLRITGDGKCIVFHDTKLGGTRVSRNTLENLRKIDEDLLLLSEALEVLENFNGTINLEVKHIPFELDRKLGESCIVEMARVLSHSKAIAKENLCLSSFSRANVAAFDRYLPNIETAFLAPKFVPLTTSLSFAISRKCDAFHVSKEQIRSGFEALVERVHIANMKVRVYTVNDEKTFRKCKEIGVDAIFTDEVEKLPKLNS